MANGNDVAVGIVFPAFAIRVAGDHRAELGHAAVLLIQGKSGLTKYFEYGRYDPANLGLVHTLGVPNVTYGSDGKPTLASLKKCFSDITQQVARGTGGGHGDTSIAGIYVDENAAFGQGLAYATTRQKDNSNAQREPNKIMSNSCLTFMINTMEAAGVWMPGNITEAVIGGLAAMAAASIPRVYADIMRLFQSKLDFDAKSGALSIQGRS